MNCLLYPYCKDLSAFVQTFSNYNEKLKITKLAAPYSWKSTMDASVEVEYVFDDALNNVDSLIMVDSVQNKYMYSDLVKKMTAVLKINKNVICSTPLSPEDVSLLVDCAKENGVSLNQYALYKLAK